MTRWKYRDGDLIRNKRSGALRRIISETYTKRLMDSQDYETEDDGMG